MKARVQTSSRPNAARYCTNQSKQTSPQGTSSLSLKLRAQKLTSRGITQTKFSTCNAGNLSTRRNSLYHTSSLSSWKQPSHFTLLRADGFERQGGYSRDDRGMQQRTGSNQGYGRGDRNAVGDNRSFRGGGNFRDNRGGDRNFRDNMGGNRDSRDNRGGRSRRSSEDDEDHDEDYEAEAREMREAQMAVAEEVKKGKKPVAKPVLFHILEEIAERQEYERNPALAEEKKQKAQEEEAQKNRGVQAIDRSFQFVSKTILDLDSVEKLAPTQQQQAYAQALLLCQKNIQQIENILAQSDVPLTVRRPF